MNDVDDISRKIGPIKKISGCSQTHCYITYDNKLYLTGRNDRGQLGRPGNADSAIPGMALKLIMQVTKQYI